MTWTPHLAQIVYEATPHQLSCIASCDCGWTSDILVCVHHDYDHLDPQAFRALGRHLSSRWN